MALMNGPVDSATVMACREDLIQREGCCCIGDAWRFVLRGRRSKGRGFSLFVA